MNKKSKTVRFKSMKDFGRSIGLSDIEMELVRQKKLMIEKLKTKRLAKGLSQKEVADLVASKQPAIARMETGLVSQVSLDFLAKVAFALGLSLELKSRRVA